MTSPIISVENLSKAYRLGAKEEAPDTLVAAATTVLKAPFRNWSRLRKLDTSAQAGDQDDILWALRDVSFEVQQGEVVGIIGRNGAGKSTLLKILSRITEPTSGRIVLRGRVSSLLEVGTGFHPELTGRDNIYMNGTILGMKKREIDRKFDEIVDFSGVEKFLDTPVKRYSSGMTVRLAFAVAAHLEPEILIVDEVLAVGDAEFQKKCLGKMQDVARGGRTVLFVSHNMAVLQSTCNRGVLLVRGALSYDGKVADAADKYLGALESCSEQEVAHRLDRQGKGEVRVSRISIRSTPPRSRNLLVMGQPACFEFELNIESSDVDLHFFICDQKGTVLSYQDTWVGGPDDDLSRPSRKVLQCDIDEVPLRSGRYYLNVGVMRNRELQDFVEAGAWFVVENGEYRGRCLPYPNSPGMLCINHRWSCMDSKAV